MSRPIPVMADDGESSSTWYCAAGILVEGEPTQDTEVGHDTPVEGVDHTVVITNATASAIEGTVAAMPGDPAVLDEPAAGWPLMIPGHSQVTVPLADLVADSIVALPQQDSASDRVAVVAAVIELDAGGVAVEQEIVGPGGRSTLPCASGAAPEWHFAWGATTRDARQLLVLFNPFPADVKVDATFSTPGEIREPVRWQGMTVPARQVVAVDVGEDVTRRSHVAASVRARDGRLVAMRLQAFDGSLTAVGMAASLGQPNAAQAWAFPYGMVDRSAGRTINETIVVYNPTDITAEVDVTVLPAGDDARVPEPFGLVIRPGRFSVLDYGDESRIAPGAAHTTMVTSDNGVPVVAERVISSSASDLRSISAAGGSSVAASTWTFPTGLGGPAEPAAGVGAIEEDLAHATSRYVVVNPDPERSTSVSLTLYGGGQMATPTRLRNIEVAAGGRVELALTGETMADTPFNGTTDDDSTPGNSPDDRAGPAASVIVHADSPVVVDRVTAVDGIDVAANPGIPAISDTLTLHQISQTGRS